MEVYFLKKLILHRSDIRGRNESQNIGECSGAKLQEPLLIPPFAPPKPISFYPSPFLSAQDQFQPIMAHFPPPFSWPKQRGWVHLEKKGLTKGRRKESKGRRRRRRKRVIVSLLFFLQFLPFLTLKNYVTFH